MCDKEADDNMPCLYIHGVEVVVHARKGDSDGLNW